MNIQKGVGKQPSRLLEVGRVVAWYAFLGILGIVVFTTAVLGGWDTFVPEIGGPPISFVGALGLVFLSLVATTLLYLVFGQLPGRGDRV